MFPVETNVTVRLSIFSRMTYENNLETSSHVHFLHCSAILSWINWTTPVKVAGFADYGASTI